MRLALLAVAVAVVCNTALLAAQARRAPADGGGWPVEPVDVQHPIRGGFLDPRPGGVFHDGVDISVDDAHPEQPAPFGHTHKVYALEGGTVWLPPIDDDTPCHSRSVRIGRFGYGHVDALGTVIAGEHVDAGELIGWTCKNEWHLHLSQFSVAGDWSSPKINPLLGGTLGPYVDSTPPRIHELRVDGDELEAWLGDPQDGTPLFAGERAPYEIAVDGRVVFRADSLASQPAFADVYAPETIRSLPAAECTAEECGGAFWFRLGPAPAGPYCVTARDLSGNEARACRP